ncbi:MAG: hypothetical protein ACLUJG_07140 [Lawsonibacter sp.]
MKEDRHWPRGHAGGVSEFIRFGPNYDPLDLESVLYIYKIEGNRTPVNHISMDVYASERAKPREGLETRATPTKQTGIPKSFWKTAVSYNEEAFSEWEAEGSSAKQQGDCFGLPSWTGRRCGFLQADHCLGPQLSGEI